MQHISRFETIGNQKKMTFRLCMQHISPFETIENSFYTNLIQS